MEKILVKNTTAISTYCNNEYEKKCWNNGIFLTGIDEVGRGCLAGPVVTCALILHPHVQHPLLKDSKVLTKKQLLIAADWIKNNAWYAFGMADHNYIDQHNIYQATLFAMQRAFYTLVSLPTLPQKPELILVDAMPLTIPTQQLEILAFTKGESRSISIAAASIMAKVMRDTLLNKMAQTFPGYYFESNKGYGSAQQYQKLEQSGATLLHRTTFLTTFNAQKKESLHDQKAGQISLFG